MTQRPTELDAPPQLAAVAIQLAELSVRKAATGGDASLAVDELVDASRWNPALLMVAADQVADGVGTCSDNRFEVALDYLRVAEERVRRRVY